MRSFVALRVAIEIEEFGKWELKSRWAQSEVIRPFSCQCGALLYPLDPGTNAPWRQRRGRDA